MTVTEAAARFMENMERLKEAKPCYVQVKGEDILCGADGYPLVFRADAGENLLPGYSWKRIGV